MPPPLISPLKRKSLGDLPDYVSKRQAIASPGEVSPRGFAPGPGLQPGGGPHPVNIQPRPNGYALGPPAPSPTVSAAPYNPAPTGRRRGRPPKSSQGTWQVSTYQPITPAPIAPSHAAPAAGAPPQPQPQQQPQQQQQPQPQPQPQPHSPGLHLQQAPQQPPPAQPVPDPKSRKKPLPEIAPRPAQAALPPSTEAEYQNWRDETYRREYYQVQSSSSSAAAAAEPAAARDRPASLYAPILPRPRSPLPPMRELPRPAEAEPRGLRGSPPVVNTAESVKEAAVEGVKT